ncbi:alpha/beta fold hydrolase [Stackebrandtia nassauensis]|uniref:Alpha/beta hydrolase fold protein n=1 Tax=Stackebrandtia nassauensis (strain DSM 44728 / CIP 108903 / NRRL B-16338 / NBRC 102104 / LLR-40K-21) TaxID=446470 RepID=D3QBX6_STANL|nr:alpha/beta fold hydrolase [Stackebrandtia nassauensis]ADD44865.1 alpha/beta hydrolase fold protein [Stackebrandtia nassauensis DSM 44728]
MTRKTISTSIAIVGCVLAGVGLVGCDGSGLDEAGEEFKAELFTGTDTFTIGDHQVNVSCSGSPTSDGPIVLLLHGGGDDLTKLADFQKQISKNSRVCSYDRLGAGKSDKPDGEQDYASVGKTLTGVIDTFANGDPVVLVGHSMGGLIAARYAPDNKDKVAGMVLLDATSPTAVADLKQRIPEDATGEAAELRAQTLAIYGGENPEKLVFTDGKVKSAGDIPVRVIQHGKQYLAAVPEYGPGLEDDWTAGQKDWLNVSSDSELDTAKDSGHYIYVDEPDAAVEAVKDVASRAAD